MEKIQGDIKKENELFESIVKNASSEISTRKDSKGHYFIVYTCRSKISAIASRILEKYFAYLLHFLQLPKSIRNFCSRSKCAFSALLLTLHPLQSVRCFLLLADRRTAYHTVQ